MIYLFSLLLGALLGALATISHAALFPLGLVIAIIGSFAGIRLIIHRTSSRAAGAAAALGWIAVIIRAAFPTADGEVLIWGQTPSTLFLVGGAISVILALLIEPRREGSPR